MRQQRYNDVPETFGETIMWSVRFMLWAAFVFACFIGVMTLVNGCNELEDDDDSAVPVVRFVDRTPTIFPTALAQGFGGCDSPRSMLKPIFINLALPSSGLPEFMQADSDGYILINQNDAGPEDLKLVTYGLADGVYSLWLSVSPLTGALPAFKVGDFRVDSSVTGMLVSADYFRLEVFDNVLARNLDLEIDGIANVAGAGATGAGAQIDRFTHFRIYQGETDPDGDGTGIESVFATCADAFGGAHAFSTQESLIDLEAD